MLKRLIIALACLVAGVAWAAPPAAELASADASARAELIAGWAVAPDAAREAALTSLENGELFVAPDGRSWLQHGEAITELASGRPATLPDDAEALVVNNRVRSAIEVYRAAGALGDVDPTVRSRAVAAIRDAGNAALLPLLQRRQSLERDAQVSALLSEAEARLALVSNDQAVRLAAIATLGESKDAATLALLEPLTRDADGTIAQAAKAASAAIEAREFSWNLVGNAFSGVSLGSVLLLAALGLAITYGLLGVINMAHGEMLMLGAYATYVVQNLFRAYLPGAFDYYLVVALPVAFAVTFIIGMVLERLVIRHLYGRPLETLLATWGISLMLMQSVRVIFGAQNVEVANPSWLSGGYTLTPMLTLPYNRIAIIAFVVLVLLACWLILNRTRLGLFVRAVTQNRRMADSVGVATARVDMLAFGLGSAIAGLGGVALSQIGNVGPDLGQAYIVDSFMVVVLGGVGQLAGTVIGAMGLGMLSKVMEPTLGAVLAKILILAFIILFIQKRPQGLFALKGRVTD
ncbi:urea ABC transporter permease subunit UrtB [Craterilacuibacter sp.]|uniref:urea ABC transporter permease subunit UrtB n=1 Tax=Craterilacuibacter sp. TaxID=2870909 RepID=UPI003F2EF8AE